MLGTKEQLREQNEILVPYKAAPKPYTSNARSTSSTVNISDQYTHRNSATLPKVRITTTRRNQWIEWGRHQKWPRSPEPLAHNVNHLDHTQHSRPMNAIDNITLVCISALKNSSTTESTRQEAIIPTSRTYWKPLALKCTPLVPMDQTVTNLRQVGNVT